MEQNTVRPIRKVAISDKLWDCLEQMATEMGGDRDGLISQALFQFARSNGYLKPGYSDPGGPAVAVLPEQIERGKIGSGPSAAPRKEPTGAAAAPPARRDPSSRREPSAPPAPRAEPAGEAPDPDQARREVAERVLETAAQLERGLKDKQADSFKDGPTRDGRAPAPPSEGGDKSLYLMAEDGSLDKVVKERFVIGRGKHCDFVINSGKVSREHAAIVKTGSDYFIEDLGSSNGTWFNKQRIQRHKIEDGDEYFICSERVKCVVQ